MAAAWEFSTLLASPGNYLLCGICLGILYLVVSALDFSTLLYLLGNSLPHDLLWEFSSSWPLFGNSPPCGLRGALLTLSLLGNLYYTLCLKKNLKKIVSPKNSLKKSCSKPEKFSQSCLFHMGIPKKHGNLCSMS